MKCLIGYRAGRLLGLFDFFVDSAEDPRIGEQRARLERLGYVVTRVKLLEVA